MNDEIVRVLEMVKDGKITTEEGEKLIEAINPSEEQTKKKSRYSMLRVIIDSVDPDKSESAKVNINVPLSIAKKAVGLMNMVPNDAKKEMLDKGIDLDAIDLAELIEMFEQGEITEDIVNIDSGDDIKGAKVRIYVD